MKKLISLFIFLFITITLFAQGINEEALRYDKAPLVFESGKKISKNGVSVVDLSGSWYEMGRAYGMLMKDELLDVKAFVDEVISSNVDGEEMAKKVVEREIRQTPYTINEFFRGASETSLLTIKELQYINAVERIAGIQMCSVLMCFDQYAKDCLVIGRNYDYSEIFFKLKDDVVMTVYHPSDGALSTATIGYAGEIYAVNGINEKGIFLELNNGTPSYNKEAENSRFTSTTLLLSILFEADELDDLELFFNTANCDSSFIINVASSENAFSYEWCPLGVNRGDITLPKGLVASSNYFVNPNWDMNTPTDEECWGGITRRNNLINLAEKNKGLIDTALMKKIIETKLEDGGAMNPLTVYQLVIKPETLEIWIKVVGHDVWVKVDGSSFLLHE